jgi:transcriptional regulator with PAS, ATPase and Fis domain
MELRIPPLRERLEDIPLLVEHFCNGFNRSFQKNIKGISDEVMQVFMRYGWPGNVRELEHGIEHAFVLCRDPIITLKHIPSEMIESAENAAVSGKKIEVYPEDAEILKILEKTYWNKAKAARLLGIDRSTLYRKMRKYQLSKSDRYM